MSLNIILVTIFVSCSCTAHSRKPTQCNNVHGLFSSNCLSKCVHISQRSVSLRPSPLKLVKQSWTLFTIRRFLKKNSPLLLLFQGILIVHESACATSHFGMYVQSVHQVSISDGFHWATLASFTFSSFSMKKQGLDQK